MTDTQTTQDSSLNERLSSGYTGARRTGLVIAILVFGVFGIWASTAPIDGASHAPGTVVVRSHKKVVQHLEGGIISEIMVDNGSVVAVGDPLVRLDSTQAHAELEMVLGQLVASQALEARLIAERDGHDSIKFPEQLAQSNSNAMAEMESQRRIFMARKTSREGRIEMLEQRIQQLESRLGGLRAMQGSKEDLLESYREELDEVQGLLSDGFSDTTRLRSVSRNHATLRGELADLISNITSTEMQMAETRMEIFQVNREFQSEVAQLLGETQTRLNELRERRTALQDVFTRKLVRAPEGGVVNGMEVHTVGGVISPGSMIAEIVPEGDELIIESRVSPTDIDRVAPGQDASVSFTAFSAQTTPRLTGSVLHVSADAFYDEQTGMSYYMARITVDPEEMEKLGDVTLVPGMPADVFISSGARTLMQYLLKPLTSAMERSFIED